MGNSAKRTSRRSVDGNSRRRGDTITSGTLSVLRRELGAAVCANPACADAAWLRQALAHLPGVLWMVDKEARFRVLSGIDRNADPALEADIGVSLLQMLQPQVEDIREQFVSAMSGELRESRQSVSGRVWQTRMSPCMDAKGVPIGLVGFSHDVTAEATAERERDETRERLIHASENERRRLSRDVHDQLGQSVAAMYAALSVLSASLGSGFQGRGRTALDLCQRTLDHMNDEIHDVMMRLRPSILDDAGLPAALEWLAERHARASGMAITREIAAIQERLEPEAETQLFRIAQEAMTNVSKHAHATAARIEFAETEGLVVMEIRDDGDGFSVSAAEAESKARGRGLVGMGDRAKRIGAALRIESRKGRGTIIHVEYAKRKVG